MQQLLLDGRVATADIEIEEHDPPRMRYFRGQLSDLDSTSESE
jgi:uncharacterized membrane protein